MSCTLPSPNSRATWGTLSRKIWRQSSSLINTRTASKSMSTIKKRQTIGLTPRMQENLTLEVSCCRSSKLKDSNRMMMRSKSLLTRHNFRNRMYKIKSKKRDDMKSSKRALYLNSSKSPAPWTSTRCTRKPITETSCSPRVNRANSLLI